LNTVLNEEGPGKEWKKRKNRKLRRRQGEGGRENE
jgi:hypothetical protein